MYTTWVGDYSKLEEFMKNVKEFEAAQGGPESAGTIGRRTGVGE
jgi:hypothetical protein